MANSSELLQLAQRIATGAHLAQTDKSGEPYITHPQRVAARMTTADGQAVAWLHDVLEDSPTTAADLANAGIPPHIIDAVVLLTRTAHQQPDEYYAAIRTNPLALEAKLADIADNTDPRRTAALDEKTRSRLAAKYERALHLLLD